VTPRYPQLADAEWLRRYYADYSAGQIARGLGCHPATVCRWLEKHGIPARPGDDFAEWQARLREWKTGPPTAGQTMYVAVLAGLLGIEEPTVRTSVKAGDVIDQLRALVDADPSLVPCAADGCDYIVDSERGRTLCGSCYRERRAPEVEAAPGDLRGTPDAAKPSSKGKEAGEA
jgi:hypothetical protein